MRTAEHQRYKECKANKMQEVFICMHIFLKAWIGKKWWHRILHPCFFPDYVYENNVFSISNRFSSLVLQKLPSIRENIDVSHAYKNMLHTHISLFHDFIHKSWYFTAFSTYILFFFRFLFIYHPKYVYPIWSVLKEE